MSQGVSHSHSHSQSYWDSYWGFIFVFVFAVREGSKEAKNNYLFELWVKSTQDEDIDKVY